MEIIEELAKGNEQYIATSNSLKTVRSPCSYNVQHLVGGEQVGGSKGLRPAHLKSYFDRLISDHGFKPVERTETPGAAYD